MKTAPVDLSEFEVNNEVVKKTVYDKLVPKVNNIDTNGYVLKTKYDTDKLDLKKKVVMQTKRLLFKNKLSAKISEIKK